MSQERDTRAARAAKAAKKRERLYHYAGDDLNPAGEVTVLGPAGHGERVVQRPETGQQFTVKLKDLTRLDEPEEGGDGA